MSTLLTLLLIIVVVRADETALVADGWVQVRPCDDVLGDVDVVRQMLDTVTRAAEALDRVGPRGAGVHVVPGGRNEGAIEATSQREFP
ncbi:MAG: hypothetical protein JNM38_15705 [Acidobacteria bacterium]|nr:hypothetical protein [Acidobacteriota bacterium]